MEIPSLLSTEGASTQAERNLAAAEAVVRAYCGWHIAPSVIEDVVLDGSGTRSLFVKTLKLRNVVAAEVSGVVVDVATLEWSEAGFLRAPGIFTDRLRSVRLTIEHGFDTAPDVAQIIRDIAARADAAPGGVVREQAGAVSITNSLTATGVSGGVVLMDHERRMLDKYRLPGRL